MRIADNSGGVVMKGPLTPAAAVQRAGAGADKKTTWPAAGRARMVTRSSPQTTQPRGFDTRRFAASVRAPPRHHAARAARHGRRPVDARLDRDAATPFAMRRTAGRARRGGT